MARVVKEHDYAARRGEILATAQRLVATMGYEHMSIQDVLDAMQMSKGAFYHYFGSKHALLEALIEQRLAEAEVRLLAIVHDPELGALAKFDRFFVMMNRWKLEQKDFLIQVLRVWYADGNAIVRQKVREAALKVLAPLFAVIAEQGVGEGTLSTVYPRQVGIVLLGLAHDIGDLLASDLLSCESAAVKAQRMEQTLAVYTDAIERVLGVAPGSITVADAAVLRAWADATEGQVA